MNMQYPLRYCGRVSTNSWHWTRIKSYTPYTPRGWTSPPSSTRGGLLNFLESLKAVRESAPARQKLLFPTFYPFLLIFNSRSPYKRSSCPFSPNILTIQSYELGEITAALRHSSVTLPVQITMTIYGTVLLIFLFASFTPTGAQPAFPLVISLPPLARWDHPTFVGYSSTSGDSSCEKFQAI